MHELSIAQSVLDAVKTEAAKRPGCRLKVVGLRVGELAGVDPGSLSFCFEALVKDSDLAPLALEIDFRPRRHECAACGRTFVVKDYRLSCPDCGDSRTRCIGGEELELAFLEMEEP